MSEKSLSDTSLMKEEIFSVLEESSQTIKKIQDQWSVILEIVEEIVHAYNKGKKVILFGNGGSAADAQHIAAEFVGKFFLERKSLPAIALHTNTSVLTALSNDYSYKIVFQRQLEAFLEDGDIVIGISTSGNSKNVVKAIEYANEKGGITVALVGEKKCKLDTLAKYVIKIPNTSTPRIQEGHITVGHLICYLVEKTLFLKS